jgi:hypothetical protein
MSHNKTDLRKLLTGLPDQINQAVQAYARANGCSEEAVLETAIVRFFDLQGNSFDDSDLQLPECYSRALEDLKLESVPTLPPYSDKQTDALKALPAEIITLLEDYFILSLLAPLQTIELAISYFLQIATISFSAPYEELPSKVREREKVLDDFLGSARGQMKRRSPSCRKPSPKKS